MPTQQQEQNAEAAQKINMSDEQQRQVLALLAQNDLPTENPTLYLQVKSVVVPGSNGATPELSTAG